MLMGHTRVVMEISNKKTVYCNTRYTEVSGAHWSGWGRKTEDHGAGAVTQVKTAQGVCI